jgi:hypothetical protein
MSTLFERIQAAKMEQDRVQAELDAQAERKRLAFEARCKTEARDRLLIELFKIGVSPADVCGLKYRTEYIEGPVWFATAALDGLPIHVEFWPSCEYKDGYGPLRARNVDTGSTWKIIESLADFASVLEDSEVDEAGTNQEHRLEGFVPLEPDEDWRSNATPRTESWQATAEREQASEPRGVL